MKKVTQIQSETSIIELCPHCKKALKLNLILDKTGSEHFEKTYNEGVKKILHDLEEQKRKAEEIE